jgi:hypothetical protein
MVDRSGGNYCKRFEVRTMTTSVFYASDVRGVNANGTLGVTPAGVFTNIDSLFDTGVTQTQSATSSGSTINPAATFGSTPASGSALIAVICRTADNIASTLAGWTQLTASGAGGVRRLEIWWRRAGALEPTTVTFGNATAAGWQVALYEFGGFANLFDPVTITTAVTGTSAALANFNMDGCLTAVGAVVMGTAISGMSVVAAAGSLETATLTSSSTLHGIARVDGFTNFEGTQPRFTWTTSRAHTKGSVGWPMIVAADFLGDQLVGNGAASTANGSVSMMGISFDTSAIPDANTVTATTLTLAAANFVAYPANTAVSAFSLAGAAIVVDASNTRKVIKKPSELSALTRVATRAGGSPWTYPTAYDWTSDSTFPGQISLTASTTILIAIDDQKTGTTRATAEQLVLSGTVTNHSLTVVHNFQSNATVTATVATSPVITRSFIFARTIIATVAALPVVTRIPIFARTIAATVSASPVVTRTATFARSIAATVATSPVITRIGTFARTVKATVANTITATAAIVITQPVRVLSLFMRNTIKIPQAVTVRLFGRSTIRIPKE